MIELLNIIPIGGITIKITIKDITKDTGLSLGTISKYLNNKPVSEQNRLLIEKSIKRLNYIPNKTAQHLRSRSSNSICILIPDIGDYAWGLLCNSILKTLKQNGYSVIIRSYSTGPDYTQDIQFLLNRQIDGTILFTDTTFPNSFLQLIKENKIPFVCMKQKPTIEADFISTSYFTTAYQATEYLVGRGHKKIGAIGLDSYTGHECTRGVLSACDKLSLKKEEQFFFLHPQKETLSAKLSEVFQISAPDITALILLDHFTTMFISLDFSLRYPDYFENLSLIAFDDDEILRSLNPPCTVFSDNFTTLGQTAANLLLQRINGDYSDFPQALFCESIFQERHSVLPLL